MEKETMLSPYLAQRELAVEEVRAANRVSRKFGLVLSEAQLQVLVEKRFQALQETGRLEFGGGILPRLIAAFCSSPYLNQHNYADTLVELQYIFYYFKNESLEALPDEDLLTYMRRSFDTDCHGSLEYLRGTSLETLCRQLRYGEEEAENVLEEGDGEEQDS